MKPFPSQIIELQADTVLSLRYFLPEVALCGTIVLMLLLRTMFGRRLSMLPLALLGAGAGLALAIETCCLDVPRTELFTGLLVFDQFTVFFRIFLLAFAVLFLLFTWRSGIPDREDGPDIYTLALGAILGMCLMASSNHLLLVFLGFEMASVPSYALAGMLKGRRRSSEAALKFAVYGAGAAGVMLYGISLIGGVLGTVHLPTLGHRLAETFLNAPSTETLAVLSLGGLMIMVGLAFKLSAFPFHFWCPDVFEGAAAEVGAFLSVASKGAALALLVRIVLGFGYLSPEVVVGGPASAPVRSPIEAAPLGDALPQANLPNANWPANELGNLAAATSAPLTVALLPQDASPSDAASSETQETAPAADPLSTEPADHGAAAEAHGHDAGHAAGPTSGQAAADVAGSHSREEKLAALAPARRYMAGLIALLAAVTATFGNLAAYGQTNIKRLLAYSTIAHAGVMMMPVAAAVELAGTSPTGAAQAIGSMAFYVAIYLFMNLGAFMVVAFVRNEIRSEEIADYGGLLRRSPGVALCFATILISLLGLPPLAGFVAKLVAFGALADARMIGLLFIGCLNGAISLFYYLRVVKVMTLDPEPAGSPPVQIPLLTSVNGWMVLAVTLPLLVFGVWWNDIFRWAVQAAQSLIQ